MHEVDSYLSTLPDATKAEFERIFGILKVMVPTAEQGLSYAMPAYLYKGKAVLSAMANKKFLSIYPFSGKVVAKLARQLADFETTSGSIHFSGEKPLPKDLLRKIIKLRLEEIESKRRMS